MIRKAAIILLCPSALLFNEKDDTGSRMNANGILSTYCSSTRAECLWVSVLSTLVCP